MRSGDDQQHLALAEPVQSPVCPAHVRHDRKVVATVVEEDRVLD